MVWRSLVLVVPVVLLACGGDGPDPSDASLSCRGDEDCDDGMFCNGPERCDPGAAGATRLGCVAGAPPCEAIACDEAGGMCRGECATPDADGDGADSVVCGGGDCDDTDPTRFPAAEEICDPEGIDEDCDPSSFRALDQDGDGHFASRCCNGDACGEDCDDNRRGTNPDVPEVCDGLDNDCDGEVDEGLLEARFVDADRDLHGDPDMPIMACPGRAGTSASSLDCDDDDPLVNGPQPELRDGADNDCDGRIDEAFTEVIWFEDADGDGFGDPDGRTIRSDAPPPGFALLPSDCDDDDPAINPRATERCNGVDDDCDGEANFEVGVNDWEDDDGDGVADAACGGPDCDDTDPDTRPLAPEACDGGDDDCDGAVDEACGTDCADPDRDGDGVARVACGGGDCDDADPGRFPGNPEICDAVDQDCDMATLGVRDDDGDGAISAMCCNGPECGTDCDDLRSLVGPVRAEVCNGLDDDCDGTVDEGGCDVDRIVGLGLGQEHTCAIQLDGDLFCWGHNIHGTLGIGDPGTGFFTTPQRVDMPAVAWTSVTASKVSTCGVADGDVYCWGRNDEGQMGNGIVGDADGRDAVLRPAVVRSGDAVSCGGSHCCAIDGGDLYCWGRNAEGQIGDGTTMRRPAPVLVLEGGWEQVEAGDSQTCARRGEEVRCWGTFQSMPRRLPTRIEFAGPPIRRLTHAGPSTSEACGIDASGALQCWREFGTFESGAPTSVAAASSGADGQCIVTRAGNLRCRGDDTRGQMGDGPGDSSGVVFVGVGPNYAVVAHGHQHVCAIQDDGAALQCWGANASDGRIGDGSTADQPAPVVIAFPPDP